VPAVAIPVLQVLVQAAMPTTILMYPTLVFSVLRRHTLQLEIPSLLA